MTDAPSDQAFEALLEYLRQTRGFDFTGYKRPSLFRRVGKRMQDVRIESCSDYVDYLEVHPEEFPFLFNTILINVTAFFRDPPTWEYVSQEIVLQILARKRVNEPVRVWSAGCASGEEAYTLVMLLAENMGDEAFRQRVKVYGTDVDEEALGLARQASYSAQQVEAVPAGLRDKYFELAGTRYVFRGDLRRSVIFGRHDLVQDAPISHMDLLVCRNALMYFNAETQGRILSRFHFALVDTGFLFLGKAEMLLLHAKLFTPVNLKHRVFGKVPQVNLRDRMTILAQAGDAEATELSDPYARLREAAFDAIPLAQIVVDPNGYLAQVNEQARSMLGLLPQDVGRLLRDLEISYRPVELRSLIERAYAERHPIKVTDVVRHLPGGEVRYLDVQVSLAQDSRGQALGVGITFRDVTQEHGLREELARSNQDRETAYEELQSANEELETTNEELQSTVEELQTTNEELQSSNEEMETMNEELQATNEELQTMNAELRRNSEDLDQMNSFLQSILASVRIGVVVVDRNLEVHLWNDRAEDLWGLKADEVVGQSLLNLDIGLPVETLREPVSTFLAGNGKYEELVLNAVNRRGKSIRCRVTCTLRLGTTGERRGVVLLMDEVGP
jgi:two-component system, chemotaxis family, CheB/CheR fusion protein